MQTHALRRKATSDGLSYNCERLIKGMEKPQKTTTCFRQKPLPWLLKTLSLIPQVYLLFPLKCIMWSNQTFYNRRLRPNCKESEYVTILW